MPQLVLENCHITSGIANEMFKRQRNEVPLLSNILNGIHSNDEDFIGANEQAERSIETYRIPNYRTAIFRVCELQLKICSKLFEPTKPTSTTVISRTSSLKRLAGRSILHHSDQYGLIPLVRCKMKFSDNSKNNNGSNDLCYYEMLPSELITFLQDGAKEFD